jgi:phosphoribosylformimino-5-aminoimidazole carboxamide ribotide isomerase
MISGQCAPPVRFPLVCLTRYIIDRHYKKDLFPMRFRPCIDLHNGKVKQIVGSTLTDSNNTMPVTNFETERPPSFFAALYRSDGLTGGHVIMLGPGNERPAVEALRAFPGGLHLGGGITPDNARFFLNEGASHVIATSFVFSGGAVQWERLALLEKTVGKNRLVLDLSCRKSGGRYIIATDRWQMSSDIALTADLLGRLAGHCDEFLVHAVEAEGRQRGPNAELVGLLASVSPITVTYAGGIRSLEDLDEVRSEGKNRIDATIGSALDIFGGTLKYKEIVAWQREQEKINP